MIVERKLHDKQSEVPPKSTKRPRGKDDQKTISSDSSARKLVYTHWLLKSEPDSRFENGVDMKVLETLDVCGNMYYMCS